MVLPNITAAPLVTVSKKLAILECAVMLETNQIKTCHSFSLRPNLFEIWSG